MAAAGCNHPADQPTPGAPGQPLAGIKFRLLVVDDPGLVAAANRLRGEWKAQTGADFETAPITEKALAAAASLDADAVVVPSAMLGALAARGLIAPLPEKVLHAQGSPWGGIFPTLQLQEAAWGKQTLAVPFGSPVLTCYYRADLLEKLHRRPPQTWEEYGELAELLQKARPAGDGPWCGTLEPLAPGWAGLTLLARAAPYAKHRDNYSALFDIKTMEPLVGGPPFVRALEELVAVAKHGPPEQFECDPARVRAEFWQGHCGMALSWPTAAGKTLAEKTPAAKSPADQPDAAFRVGFAELPGAPQVYNASEQKWEPLGEGVDPHVSLLGVSGRVAAVSAKTEHPEAVWQLLLWLSGERWSGPVCGASPATTLFRHTHVQTPGQWTEKQISPAAAAQYAALAEKVGERSACLMALRLPGRAEYLAALDEAVRAAVRGEATPADALKKAADRWREITERQGHAEQQTAYMHSLGLE